MKKLIIITFAGILFPLLTNAQPHDTLSVDADFFVRGEIRKDGLANGESDKDMAAFLLQRTLVGIDYKRKWLELRFSGQYSGTWGGNSSNSISIYEAWLQLNTKPGIFVRAGRQNLSYDDQRIFGSDDWAVTGKSHDVLRVGYEGYGHKVHLFAAYNQNLENIGGGSFYIGGFQPYKALEAIWYHYDIPRINTGASLLFMNVGMQGGDSDADAVVYQQQLAGAHLSTQQKIWDAGASFYYQFGTHESGIPLRAWMTAVKASVRPLEVLRIRSGYDYLSGDKYFAAPPEGQIGMVRHDVVRGFSSIYGSHHKFYGAMDFFYVQTYVNGFTPGLQNAYLGLTWSPVPKKVELDACYHFLAMAAKLDYADRPLGHELEFSASWQIFKDVKLQAGYTFMTGTESMEILKRTGNNNHLHWGWIMLSATPGFLKAR